MKSWVIVSAIAILVVGIECAVYQLVGSNNAKFPDADCWTEESGPMKVGQMVTVPGCSRYECLGGGHIESASCGLEVYVGDCSSLPKAEDVKDKPYPDCCLPKCESG